MVPNRPNDGSSRRAQVANFDEPVSERELPFDQNRIDSVATNIEQLKRITVEEGKRGGRACVRGLRIRVLDILDLLAAGASYEEILADYPFLEREDILAAIEYATRQADHVVLQTS